MPSRRLKVGCLTALLTVVPIAFCEEGAAPGRAAAAAPAASDAADQVVCRRERVAGSNIRRRVCRSRAQIEAERDASQEGYRDLTQQPTRSEGSGGG